MSDVKSRAIKALRDKSVVHLAALHIKSCPDDHWQVLVDPQVPTVGMDLEWANGELKIKFSRAVCFGMVTLTNRNGGTVQIQPITVLPGMTLRVSATNDGRAAWGANGRPVVYA